MNLTNILPSVIADLVLTYCDPVKEAQQRNQIKINRAFDQAQKKNAYDILSIGNNVGWHDFSKQEINEIRYPSAKAIKEDMKFYKKHRRTIKEYLENNKIETKSFFVIYKIVFNKTQSMVHIEDRDDLKKKIKNKMSGYRRCDKKKRDFYPILNKNLKSITTKDAIKLVDDLESDLCSGCGCKMLFTNYTPYCIYQFSFDRKNNKMVHTIDNLNIVCWNCNSCGWDTVKDHCPKGCHTRLPTKG